MDDSFVQAAARALREKADISAAMNFRQLLAWHNVGRDPRGWVISLLYYALERSDVLQNAVQENKDALLGRIVVLDADASSVRVLDTNDRPIAMAFDHLTLLAACIAQVRQDAQLSDVTLDALPGRFTLRELQTVHEAIYGHSINKDSFRRSITKSRKLVTPADEWQDDVDHRPAQMYRRNS
jgi:8-oxo-dGTP diphosphatase